MAAPKVQTEAEIKAEVLVAFRSRDALSAPDPVEEVAAAQLARLAKRVADLEARVAALEGA